MAADEFIRRAHSEASGRIGAERTSTRTYDNASDSLWKIVMDIFDYIVAVVLLTPLIYGAIWYYCRGKFTSEVADGMVRDLVVRSQLAAKNSRNA